MKKKYTIGTFEFGSKHAGGKAVQDVYTFASELGYKPLMYGRKTKIGRAAGQLNTILKLMGGGILLVQYPSTRHETIQIIRKLNPKAKMIGFVHDLFSIRYREEDIQSDIDKLNLFDVLIVHNQVMKDILENHGIVKKMISLDVFDYDYRGNVLAPLNTNSLCFAGNLEKSRFIYQLDQLKSNIDINLYGIGFDASALKDTANQVHYKGSFPADDLPAVLDGAFGLIWDGDDIHTCTGLLGEYTRINNPHKLSLYLASNKPVIAWKEAAISSFIHREKVGFTVGSLTEIPNILNQLSESEYNDSMKNVNRLGKQLREGHYTKSALKEAENYLNQLFRSERRK